MPFQIPPEIQTKIALIVPTSDAKALLTAMGGTAGEGDAWTVPIMGMPWQAATGKDKVVLSMTPDNAKAVASCEKGIAAKLKPAEVDALKEMDLALWIRGEKMIEANRSAIDGFMGMLKMMNAAQPQMAEAQEKQIKMLLDGMATGIVGISIGEGGLGLRFTMTMKPESEMAKLYKITTSAKSLLKGLPAGKYLGVMGQIMDPKQAEEGMKTLDPYVAVLKGMEGVDGEQVDRIKKSLDQWVPLFTAVRASVEAVTPGPEGLFAFHAVVETTDSGKWMELCGQIIDELLKLNIQNEHYKELCEYVTHKAGASEVAGVKVDECKLDLFELARKNDAPDEDIESMKKVVGKDGLVLRMGAVDKNKVVVCLGGASHMSRLVEQARGSDAPLDADAGIKKVSRYLPENRASVAFIAVDNICEFARTVAEAVGEEMFPLQFPQIQAPLAFSGTGGTEWAQFDVLVPTELMVAGKNAAMMMMGMMGGGAPEEAPPETPETPEAPEEHDE